MSGRRFPVASGEKSEMISVYVIDPASGALKLLQKYPTEKGANWVEIACSRRMNKLSRFNSSSEV